MKCPNPSCGEELQRVPWNDIVDILVCNNGSCPAFKSPIPIPVGAQTPEDVSTAEEQMKEVRLEESLSKKLQRLRRTLYSEN